jgi:hypothetical protein
VARRGSSEWPVVSPQAAFAAPPRAAPRRISRYVEHVAFAAGWPVGPDRTAVAALIEAYATACAAGRLDPLLVICQLLVETDGLRSASSWLRVDPAGLDGRQIPARPGFHASWQSAAQFHAKLVADEAARGADSVGRIAHQRGGQTYLDCLLSHTDSILMPQY